MSGHPNPPYSNPPYGGATPPPNQYGQSAYGQPSGYGQPTGQKPPAGAPQSYAYPPQPYGNPYGNLGQSVFAPGTDPEIIRCFQMSDQDGSGFIDDKEMQRVLSSTNQSFSMRTVHLLMYHFTNSNSMKIGPKEFTSLWYGLQGWRAIFERFDRDRSGKIDTMELRDALLSLGYSVSPSVLQILVLKYDRTGQSRGIDYDNFIECSLVVKGLTDKFKEKDTGYTGSATLTYEAFMLTVLPFIVA
eukprot:Gb_20981 [translate_table: standard]